MINKLSDLVSASAPVVIAAALVVFLIMLSVEQRPGRRARRVGRYHAGTPTELVTLALGALIVGAIAGAISVIPWFKARTYDVGWGNGGYFHNYELLAAVMVGALSAVGAWRGATSHQLVSFVVGTSAGMSLAIVAMKPGNEFTSTFLSWATVIGLLTFVVSARRSLSRLLIDFWRVGRRPRPDSPEGTE